VTMQRLPDDSAFFTATIGERSPGLLNCLKYHGKGYARGWLLLWRNTCSAHELSRIPEIAPKTGPMSWWKSLRWALSVHPRRVRALPAARASGPAVPDDPSPPPESPSC
jgi:hypothetical protein